MIFTTIWAELQGCAPCGLTAMFRKRAAPAWPPGPSARASGELPIRCSANAPCEWPQQPRKAGRASARPGARAPVSYTHLRAHETGRNVVCRVLLEKKNISEPTRQAETSYAVFC